MAPFHWIYFPLTLNEYGALRGMAKLLLIQVSAAIFIWFIYDLFRKDLIGIVSIKKQMRSKVPAMGSHGHSGTGQIERPVTWKKALVYVFLSWQLIPPLVVLCLRRDGERFRPRSEIALIMGSALIDTLWWSLISLGVLNLISFWPS